MLIVSLFFARCCFNFISLLQHVLFQSFWFSCFPTRNNTFHESRWFFEPEKYCFYCGSWCNMKGWVFLIGICNVFYVSMKRDMLIVTFFLLVVVSTSTPCCNMLQHVLLQSFHGARSQTLLAGCKLDIDSSLIFFKAVKTVCKPGFLLIWCTASKFLCSMESSIAPRGPTPPNLST